MSSSRASEGAAMRKRRRLLVPAIVLGIAAVSVHAQAPAPAERVSFQDAIRRAVDKNPSAAFATADAYLTIIGRRRLVESSETARDVAKAHFDLAHQLQERGTGSRLNELRAQQAASIDEGLVESARLALYRAQEALGVLLG